jgi:hypothetical protein
MKVMYKNDNQTGMNNPSNHFVEKKIRPFKDEQAQLEVVDGLRSGSPGIGRIRWFLISTQMEILYR